MTLPVFSIRCSHTGQFADGRPNDNSVLIADLDAGLEYQTRKSPCYVPAGGSIDIPVTTRSIFSLEKGSIAKLAEAGLIATSYVNGSAGEGIQPVYCWGNSSGGGAPSFLTSDNLSIQKLDDGIYEIAVDVADFYANSVAGSAVVNVDGGTFNVFFSPPTSRQISISGCRSSDQVGALIETKYKTSLRTDPDTYYFYIVLYQYGSNPPSYQDLSFTFAIFYAAKPSGEAPQLVKSQSYTGSNSGPDNVFSRNMVTVTKGLGDWKSTTPGSIYGEDARANTFLFGSFHDASILPYSYSGPEVCFNTIDATPAPISTFGGVLALDMYGPMGKGPIVAWGSGHDSGLVCRNARIEGGYSNYYALYVTDADFRPGGTHCAAFCVYGGYNEVMYRGEGVIIIRTLDMTGSNQSLPFTFLVYSPNK